MNVSRKYQKWVPIVFFPLLCVSFAWGCFFLVAFASWIHDIIFILESCMDIHVCWTNLLFGEYLKRILQRPHVLTFTSFLIFYDNERKIAGMFILCKRVMVFSLVLATAYVCVCILCWAIETTDAHRYRNHNIQNNEPPTQRQKIITIFFVSFLCMHGIFSLWRRISEKTKTKTTKWNNRISLVGKNMVFNRFISISILFQSDSVRSYDMILTLLAAEINGRSKQRTHPPTRKKSEKTTTFRYYTP